jgi:membrane protein involved in colicin uptake
MSEIERRLRELANRLSAWLQSGSKTAKERGAGSSEQLRREAKVRAQQAAAKAKDFRDSERGQRAATKLNDLRDSDTAKKAEAKLNDLRDSEAGQKAQAKLADLRQREPVKKAEENARKVLNDLFSGDGAGRGSGPAGSGTAGSPAAGSSPAGTGTASS